MTKKTSRRFFRTWPLHSHEAKLKLSMITKDLNSLDEKALKAFILEQRKIVDAELAAAAVAKSKAEVARKEARKQEDLENDAKESVNLHVQAIAIASDPQLRDEPAKIAPFDKGDVVIDDLGVKYRVYRVGLRGKSRFQRNEPYYVDVAIDGPVEFKNTVPPPDDIYVEGIRLTATGNEAYARPREIVSTTLTKFVPGGTK